MPLLVRCMNTRRDNPTGSLWRISLDCFNKLVADDGRSPSLLDAKTETTAYRLTRARLWKKVADVYEIFLVGSCGRALTSDVLKADELIEMNFLKVLGEHVLKGQVDAPVEVHLLLLILLLELFRLLCMVTKPLAVCLS